MEVDQADLLSPWLNRYRDWFQENVLTCRWTEQRVVSNRFGYAGTADLLIEHKVHGLCLVDLKTTKMTTPHPNPLPDRGREGEKGKEKAMNSLWMWFLYRLDGWTVRRICQTLVDQKVRWFR